MFQLYHPPSADAWHFVDHFCLLLRREVVYDLNEERIGVGEYRSDVEVPTHPPDLLTNAS